MGEALRRAFWVSFSVGALLWIPADVAATPAAPSRTLVLDAHFSDAVLGPLVSVFVDPTGTLDIDAVRAIDPRRFEPNVKAVPSYGFSDAIHWFRIEVRSAHTRPADWLLEVGYPHLDSIDLYGPDVSGAFKHSVTGDQLPFRARDIDYRNFVFEVTTPPGAHVYFLRVQSSGPLTVPLNAWSPRGFFQHVNAQLPPLWMFYGVMLVMAAYNLFIFFSV